MFVRYWWIFSLCWAGFWIPLMPADLRVTPQGLTFLLAPMLLLPVIWLLSRRIARRRARREARV
jgi:hypothetical protein